MRAARCFCLAIATAALPLVACAGSAAPRTQITIDILANGKNVARIVLPPGAKLQIQASSVVPTPGNENVVHARGAASVSVTMGDAELGTIYADELVLTKEAVNAGWVTVRSELEKMRADDQAARNKLIDVLRRRGHRISIPIEDVMDTLHVEDKGSGLLARDIDTMLAQLKAPQREIVQSISLDGSSIRDTAQRLRMTEGAVRVALHRALKALGALYRSSARED